MFFDERIRIRTSDLIRVGNKKPTQKTTQKHKKTPKKPSKNIFFTHKNSKVLIMHSIKNI